MNPVTHEKLIIIGSGPAGLTSAIYGARAFLNPLVIEGNKPLGQLMSTTHVENWPGEISILGPELMFNLQKHAQHFGTRFLGEEITKVDFQRKPFILHTSRGKILSADAIIIATGATAKRLNIPGEEQFWGKGVSSCAVCDGAFFKDEPVIIVGGGDSAMENALFMKNFTKDVTIVHILPQLTASQTMKHRVMTDAHIKIIYSSTVQEIVGQNGSVTGVNIVNVETKKNEFKQAKAVFIAIGMKPNTDIFKGQLNLDNYGYILLNGNTQTSVPGIFAAGDVADYKYRQAITSAGSGCAALLDAERDLAHGV